MASKVMVKIPVAPFGQVNKTKPSGVNADLLTVARAPEMTAIRTTEIQKPSESSRVAQLEQNIRFLQEQHQSMLNGLHHEIDSLRHRNRELQFQLVFAKTSLPSTPSSPDDDTKPKVNISPKQVNVTPLQVELLEREVSDLKIQLQEAESRNVYLSAIVDEQKKKLERYERERERERERGIQPDPELLRKLDDAEALIRRLRRENSDLRRENSTSPTGYSNRDSYHGRDGSGSHHHGQKNNANQNRGGNGGSGGRNRGNGGHYRNWFPPLHSQNYWQNIRGVDKNATIAGDGSQLPNLQTGGGGGGGGGPINTGGGGGGGHQGRRGGNNNHYHNGDGRKFRGGQNRGNKPS
ncbi:hypothetical protein AMK59_4541 [Oryctes borbonicus]|uniref:CCDC92/74 N-terminal domain-containing protein n=1 Tax=Oryctes borbonicus TaxID=1629725 RepID=A0A0T6B819_9SCAR|nr:hypothetical protein AMK59_4541 [Oryctes borbonicus]